jgi:hypothetical protein
LVLGSWFLDWRLETGEWRMENGDWKMKNGELLETSENPDYSTSAHEDRSGREPCGSSGKPGLVPIGSTVRFGGRVQ